MYVVIFYILLAYLPSIVVCKDNEIEHKSYSGLTHSIIHLLSSMFVMSIIVGCKVIYYYFFPENRYCGPDNENDEYIFH